MHSGGEGLKNFIGIPDDSFIRGRIPMTKQEVRILTIAKLCLPENGVIADIGAGTGSLSIEAALQMPQGHVFSIERKPEGIELIRANAAKFEVSNISIIEAEAPDGMDKLPDLDAAVIGGSGSKLSPILEVLDKKLKPGAHLVLNCVTLQTISQASDWLRSTDAGYTYEIIQVQVNRWDQIGPYDMAKALNPIFILTAVKK